MKKKLQKINRRCFWRFVLFLNYGKRMIWKYSGNPNTGHSNYGTIGIMDYQEVSNSNGTPTRVTSLRTSPDKSCNY